jgi:hypothetical protein
MPVNSPSENALPDVTVWYDSDCPLCIREIDLMRAIPMLRPLGLLAKSRPVLWVLERLYIGFLRIRPWLQRRVRRIVQN